MSKVERQEVKVYWVRLRCKCGGELRATGVVVASMREHRCASCGRHEMNTGGSYPAVEYVGANGFRVS